MKSAYRSTQLAETDRLLSALFPVSPRVITEASRIKVALQDADGRCEAYGCFRSTDQILCAWAGLMAFAKVWDTNLVFCPGPRKCAQSDSDSPLDDVGWDESQDLDTIEIVNPKRLAHRSRKNGRHVATALSKTWCVWCKHEVASKDFMAHIGHMAEDELDMIIVQSGLVVEGYVLLEDACDEVDTVRTAQRLLQKRFGETAQYSGENGDERFHEYMGVPSVVNQPEEGRRDRHRQRVCNVVKWATTRYGMNHVMKILERGRAP